MIIDCHTHLGRNDHIRASVDELLHSMDGAKIDKALVFAGELNDITTSQMLEEIKNHKDRLMGVASWDTEYRQKHRAALAFEQVDRLIDLYKAKEIVAVKFYTGYDHFYPREVGGEVLWRMNEVGCPAIFHSGDCLNSVKCAKLKYAHPLHIDEVAVDFPKMNFIIAHMAYPWVKDAAEVCYKNANVYSDISGFVYGEFEGIDKIKFQRTLQEFLSVAGSDKLLFGTDWPISNQHSYVEALDWCITTSLEKLPISAKELTQNTVRAFNLKV